MATYDTIISNIQAVLPSLNSGSGAAIFKKIARAIGISLDNTLSELSNTQSIIENVIGTQRYGRSGYYVDKALAYQEGDDLVVDPVTFDYVYATIDDTKKIIIQAAFESVVDQGTQILTLKVARLNPDTGKLDALTNAQKTSFDSYFTTFEIPGLPVTKVSLTANVFSFTAIVTYYSTYDLNTLKANVTAALYDFRDNYRFNGELFVNDLENYIANNVPGIRNCSLSNTTIDGAPFTGSVKLSAGYFDYPNNITDNLTYGPF